MISPPAQLATFVHEVEDLLERIESAILALETRPDDPELVHTLFRAFHTLKGSSGVVGVTTIARFTHHVESAMDRVRSGAVGLTPALVSTVLAARDHVAALLQEALGGPAAPPTRSDEIVAELTACTGASAATAPAPAPPAAYEADYHVTFAPSVAVEELACPRDAIRTELAALGSCTDLDADPTPWRFAVTTARGENAIRDAFIFIAGQGELTIEMGLALFPDEPEPAPAPVEAPKPAAPAAPAAKAAKVTTDATVRVASARLDHLVKLIGELVITQSRLRQAHAHHPVAEMAQPVETLERLLADLRDGVLGLRMVPIGALFSRFHRLVRDLSRDLDKEIDLVTAGDETELDKTVIDQLGDALVHVLRNSMDHGLEPAGARLAAGKPRRGTLRLSAAQEGTYVVVTIADDGRGIDLAAVRRKAEAQGLVAPDAVLSEQDTIALITRPGFSTAAQVTEVSGRGVGMDVVKKTVEGLRGSLTISSRAGQGTEIKLSLPLTLAIIDGLVVDVAGDRFVVPLGAVTENLELTAAERRLRNGRNAIAVRGDLVPYIRLRDAFETPGEPPPIERIVVVSVAGARFGIVVDRVVGSDQTVIQPLGRFFRGVDIFSGTTIMGDGRVAMILDLAGVLRTASTSGTRAAS